MMTHYKIFLTKMSNLDVISFIQNECFQLLEVAAADTACSTHVMVITSPIHQKTYQLTTTQNTMKAQENTNSRLQVMSI